MRVVLLLAAFAGATAFAPIGTSTLMLRNLVPFSFYVNRDSMCTTRYTRRLGHLVCTLASPDEQLETEEHDEPMNRKERRRLNRRNRNNQRNRIVDQRTQVRLVLREASNAFVLPCPEILKPTLTMLLGRHRYHAKRG